MDRMDRMDEQGILVMTVWFKQGVMGELVPKAQKGLGRVAKLYHRKKLDLYVTCIRESNHLPGSFHYIGRAFDIRARGVSKEEILKALGVGWDVIYYTRYRIFHCELDDGT